MRNAFIMGNDGGIFPLVKVGGFGPPLDKLEQLGTEPGNPTRKPYANHEETETVGTLAKRAKAKFYSLRLAIGLANLDSPLVKSYWGTYRCANALEQLGDKITTRYCGHRWCTVCNRIRTAKLIKGYQGPLAGLQDKWFVTLTLPNVQGADLRTTIKAMTKTSQDIQDTFKKRHQRRHQCWQLIGLRKLECTYNWRSKDFHPHFHFIVSGQEAAEALKAEWLIRVPTATTKAQHICPTREGSEKELFKYFSKLVTNVDGRRYSLLEPLNAIFVAMQGLRVFQPIGLKKDVSEDIADVQSVKVEGIEAAPECTHWLYDYSDWVNHETGEARTGYLPSEHMETLVKNILPDLPPTAINSSEIAVR